MPNFTTIEDRERIPKNFIIFQIKPQFHKGRLYEIITTKRLFSTIERIEKVALGCLALICTLFFGILSPRVRNLFTQRTAEIALFGIPQPLIDDAHYKDLNQLLKGRYLFQDIEIKVEELEELDAAPRFIYIDGQPSFLKASPLSQDCRSFVQVLCDTKNRFDLVLPNMAVTNEEEIIQSWPRMVDEERKTLSEAHQIGLLSPFMGKVEIKTHSSFTDTIPAYTYFRLERLAEKGIFIRDNKNGKYSTWKETDRLFESDEEYQKPENWHLLTRPLLMDVKTIVDNNMPTTRSRLSIAVEKSGSNPIRLRCFYGCCHEIDEIKYQSTLTDEQREKLIKETFEWLLVPLIKFSDKNTIQNITAALWTRAIQKGLLTRNT